MVSSASSRCPQTFMLKEKTVPCSNSKACSRAWVSCFSRSATACSISFRIASHDSTPTLLSSAIGHKRMQARHLEGFGRVALRISFAEVLPVTNLPELHLFQCGPGKRSWK